MAETEYDHAVGHRREGEAGDLVLDHEYPGDAQRHPGELFGRHGEVGEPGDGVTIVEDAEAREARLGAQAEAGREAPGAGSGQIDGLGRQNDVEQSRNAGNRASIPSTSASNRAASAILPIRARASSRVGTRTPVGALLRPS
jgi:hypothetical protein